MRKFKVRCSYELLIEFPDDTANPEFLLEDNGCPGAGLMGDELRRLMRKHEERGTCWACACNGEVKITEELK